MLVRYKVSLFCIYFEYGITENKRISKALHQFKVQTKIPKSSETAR